MTNQEKFHSIFGITIDEVRAMTNDEFTEWCIGGELKPCPFCGGRATYDTNGAARWAICTKCGARSRMTIFDGEKGKGIIRGVWNRRAE